MQEVIAVVGDYLIWILGGIATVLFSFVFKRIADMIKVKVVQTALDIIKDSIINVIKSSIKEIRDKYEEAMEDGELSKEEVEEIKMVALKKAQKEIPDVVKKLAGLADDELEEYIIDFVETILGEEIGEDIKKYF